MKFLADTNTCITYLNKLSPILIGKFESYDPSDVALCSVVKIELLYGALKSQNRQKNLEKMRKFFAPFPSLPLDDQTAEIAAQIRVDLFSQGIPIGPSDLLIAAIALTHNLIVITANEREFRRIKDLKIENWTVPIA